jgi:hypothetical protein
VSAPVQPSFSDVLGDALDPEADIRFDRFYFNIYGPTRADGFGVIGAGLYPVAGVADGFTCFVVGDEQRNLRFSDAGVERQAVGPLRWETIADHREWRLVLERSPSGVAFDLTWTANAPTYEIGRYEVNDVRGESSHAHYFQSGTYDGWLEVDGRRIEVDGWHGQRDRSRGARRVRDSLGMHQWVQIQLDGESVGFLFNEDRQGNVAHCDGAIMRRDGTIERVTAVRHDVTFGEDFEVREGRLEVDLADGGVRAFSFASTGRGIYMTGGGYAGLHGTDRGREHLAVERWPLDGTRNPRNLDLGISDALCTFDDGVQTGLGIFEYALSRSSSYAYAPTLDVPR